jgi:multiple sugar transport system substrate-binding protein
MRPPRFAFGGPRRPRRGGVLAGALILASGTLAACSSTSGDELVWYINPDTGGQATLAEECSTDDYTITTQVLPQSASEQRVQLIRRLAANDPTIDLMSLDPPFTAEFANAGYLAAIPDELTSKLEGQSFDGAVAAATWNDELVVAPFWSNTQVLWYRKSFVEQTDLDMAQPVTWQQIIDAAASGGGQVGVQANKYEGYSVWINALVSGAGGQLVENPEAGVDADVTIDSEAGQAAAGIIEALASSPAAPPDLSVSNEGTAGATFAGDTGSFLVNWTYIFNSYEEATPGFNEDIGYARYPQTVEGQESRPPYGGIAIGVNDSSEKKDQAFEAVECLTSPENQAFYGIDSGNMPASADAYDVLAQDPENPYPADLLELFQESVDAAAPRTVSPYWSDISGSLLSTWHPPASVSDGTPADSQTFTEQILQGERLL